MISAWTKACRSEEEKQELSNQINGSKVTLTRLQQLLDEMKCDCDNIEMNTKIYDLPNWDYRQADVNGYKRCLKQVSKLINLDQGNND